MSDLGPQTADQVLAAAQAGAAEAATALSRAFSGEYALLPGEPATYRVAAPPAEFTRPGLVLAVDTGPAGAALLIPGECGLFPAWCAQPDITGQSKLSTLAQELGMLLLPEAMMPIDFRAACVSHLGEALQRGGVAEGAGMLPLNLRQGAGSGTAYLVWPAAQWQALVEVPKNFGSPPVAAPSASKAVQAPTRPRTLEDGIPLLPRYGRSLLRISIPVSVTLAAARQPVGKILELGPGSILQFEKSCNEPIELQVGNQTVAVGEAVKVGEKFGIRITAMVLPEERFLSVTGRARSA